MSAIIHPALRPSSPTATATNTTMSQSHIQGPPSPTPPTTTTTPSSVEDSLNKYQSANEVLHDTVTLLSGNNGPRRVILSVFRTTTDHFALIYPDNRRKAVAIKPAGCINLRGVTCEETLLGSGLKGFTLRPKKCDTSSRCLTFICSEPLMLPKWIEALSSVPIATLHQSDDEESEDEDEVLSSSPSSPTSSSSSRQNFNHQNQSYHNKYSRPTSSRRLSPRQSSLSSLDEEDEE